MKQRADLAMVEVGLAPTRSRAKLLIKEGAVWTNDKMVKKPGEMVLGETLRLSHKFRFVGRGGEKLDHALNYFALDMTDLIVADIGASTGGFTDCCLQRGAKKVYAIDVGHDQLASSLIEDSRVINMEGCNIRSLSGLEEQVDFVVADLSYISLRLVLDKMFALLTHSGECVTLFKPQFEVGRENVGKGGIVKNLEQIYTYLLSFYDWACEHQFYIYGITRSPILGKQGNREFLLHLGQREELLMERQEFMAQVKESACD